MNSAVINRSFAPEDINQIGAELDRSGFVCLDSVIHPAWVARAQRQVDDARKGRDVGVFTVLHPKDIADSATQEIARDPEINGLMKGLVAYAASSAGNENDELYTVLRIVGGGNEEKVVPLYHYDSSTLTILVPIYIPRGEQGLCGDLVIIPNKRNFRKFVVINVIEKILVQSRRFNIFFHKRLMNGQREEIKVLNPGNLYLFWGYRSYHGNFGCSPGALRATLLLHFGNPHSGTVFSYHKSFLC